jgi:NAD(P)-dependent dehydrogenase (short-subunit alcohol dehydrogenase family)
MIAHRPTKGSVVATGMAGGIEHMTRALAVELAPLRVNAVCPGAIHTEIWNVIPEAQRADRLREMGERVPLKRIGEPGEVAEAYLYLMRGGYTTGQVLYVDGGQSVV